MSRTLLISLIIYCISINLSFAQTIDLTSVDEFIVVTSALKEGNEVTEDQWIEFENSTGYRRFAEREDKFLINTI